MSTRILKVEEDPETGDYLLTFPDDLIAELGWKEGDTLVWNIDEHNNATLKKKVD